MNALLIHPRIYLDASGASTDALLVRDGRVAACGEQARAMHDPRREPKLTPPGVCLFPALADAHIHLWGLGQRVGLLSLQKTRSPQEILDKLSAHPRDASSSGWIEGHGWDQHAWPEGANLTRAMLDQVSDTPGAPEAEAAAGLMLRAMIQAAKSDGGIDAAEKKKILETVGEDADAESLAFVKKQLSAEVDPEALARDTPDAQKMQVYSMSLMPIRVDTEAEAQYLDTLASELGLDQQTVNMLHLQMGVQPLYA